MYLIEPAYSKCVCLLISNRKLPYGKAKFEII